MSTADMAINSPQRIGESHAALDLLARAPAVADLAPVNPLIEWEIEIRLGTLQPTFTGRTQKGMDCVVILCGRHWDMIVSVDFGLQYAATHFALAFISASALS